MLTEGRRLPTTSSPNPSGLAPLAAFFIRHRRRTQQAVPSAGVQMGAMPGAPNSGGSYPYSAYPPAGAWGAPGPQQQYGTQPPPYGSGSTGYGGGAPAVATGYPWYPQAPAAEAGAGPSSPPPHKV